jgi:hypothetical protein
MEIILCPHSEIPLSGASAVVHFTFDLSRSQSIKPSDIAAAFL